MNLPDELVLIYLLPPPPPPGVVGHTATAVFKELFMLWEGGLLSDEHTCKRNKDVCIYI